MDPESLDQLISTMLARLHLFKQSVHLEVQERVLAIQPLNQLSASC